MKFDYAADTVPEELQASLEHALQAFKGQAETSLAADGEVRVKLGGTVLQLDLSSDFAGGSGGATQVTKWPGS